MNKRKNTNIINQALKEGRTVDYNDKIYIVYLKNKSYLVLKETEVNVDDIQEGIRMHPTISPDWWNEKTRKIMK